MKDLINSFLNSEWLSSLTNSDDDASSAASRGCADADAVAGDMAGVKPSLCELEPIKLVGTGGFGAVILVRHVVTGRPYALKTMDVSRVRAQRQAIHVNAERSVLESIDHPYIVKLHGTFRTGTTLNLVLDYCPGGDMYFHLNRMGQLPLDWARFYTAELVLALKTIHEHNVLYRDLKPENVLLDGQGHIRLADFGLAKTDMCEGARTYSLCGTAHYLAPEVVSKVGYGKAVDYWALGCLVYELLTGLPPFYHTAKNRSRLYRAIRAGNVDYPSDMSDDAVDLISGLLSVDPLDRLGARPEGGVEELMAHPFFDGIDWDAMERRELPAPMQLNAEADSTCHVDPEFTALPIDMFPQSTAPPAEALTDEFAEWDWCEDAPQRTSCAPSQRSASVGDIRMEFGDLMGPVGVACDFGL